MPNYKAMARASARKYGLDPDIFQRQIQQESGFNPNARSPAGALGIAQIMPATARGWKVNPLDPRAALDVAARNMASYVRKYGGYERALRAYNAGPGAIEKSKGYRETNHYVATILNGRDPGRLGSPSRRSASAPVTPESPAGARTVTTPGVDNSGVRKQMLAQYLLTRNDPNALLSLGVGLRGAQDVPATSRTVPVAGGAQPAARAQSPAGSSKRGTPGVVRELFYDPLGGWDEGRKIPAIGGHGNHVHVAARSHGAAVSLAKTAKRFGLTVRELEPFDKVDPVHTSGSFHYSGKALDVSGPPEKMRAYAEYVRRKYRLPK